VTELQNAFIKAQFAVDPARGDLLRHLQDQVNDVRQELYGQVAPDLGGLLHRLRTANAEAASIIDGTGSYSPDEIDRVFERVSALHSAARDVADCANYHRVRKLMSGLGRRRAIAAAVAACGIFVFAWATNPDRPAEPLRVQIEQPAVPASPAVPPPATGRPR
jgi:hypothetical protein